MLLHEMRRNNVHLFIIEEDASVAVKAGMFTDADSITRNLLSNGIIVCRRTRPLMAQLRQLHLEYGLNITWIDTKLMLADPLTKLSVDPQFLIDAVNSGRWCGASTKEETTEATERIRQARRLRKLREKTSQVNK